MTYQAPTAHGGKLISWFPALCLFSRPQCLPSIPPAATKACFPPQKLPPCETKPVSLQEIVATQQNGCVKSVAEASELTLGPTCPHHVPVQVEQDEEPAAASLNHCTIEISELETNV